VLRTHNCGELRKGDKGEKVILAGWVHSLRTFGRKAFVDLRDRYGVVQLVLDQRFKDLYDNLTRETVLAASGKVALRKSPNPQLETGEVEVLVEALTVVSKAAPLPFEIFNPAVESTEETRLTYRYLDVRRPEVLRTLEFRFRAEMALRNFFSLKGFLEVETPYLGKPTPEGARDFLVPTRNRGKFWALPQSPQQYKQLLMVGGVDRYFQVVRCFRDEDLRKDRQYEFTQLDVEMSFITEEDVMNVSEGAVSLLYSDLLGIKLKTPFKRLTWEDALNRFGSDKPDLRFKMELKDYSKKFKGSGLDVFEDALEKGGVAKGITVAELLGKRDIKSLETTAKRHGFPGVAWVKSSKELSGPVAKKLKKEFSRKRSTTVLLAGPWERVCKALGEMRLELGEKLGLQKGTAVLWVTDFPLFEWSETDGRVTPMHHPFTAPKKGCEADVKPGAPDAKLLQVPSRAYDLVINGVEIGGGSIRITDPALQERVFKVLGIDKKRAREKFGMLLEAFEYGVPPHGGIAFGLDRLLQVMLAKDSIRDVMAFPKSKSGRALMEDAPSGAEKGALDELGLKLK
jgi:aspartyl-tRNA synthetase